MGYFGYQESGEQNQLLWKESSSKQWKGSPAYYATVAEMKAKVREYCVAYQNGWLYSDKFDARCPSANNGKK